MKFERKELFTLAGSLIVFLLLIFTVKVSNLSVGGLVNLQNTLFRSAILQTNGLSTISALYVVLQPFLGVFFALILLAVYFSFLTAYGFKNQKNSVGLLTGLLSALLVLFIFHSIISVFVAAALLITSAYTIPLANTYAQELKKWPRFRVGSNAAAKALLIFNVLIAVGVFVSILSSAASYETSFKTDLTASLEEIAFASIPDVPTTLMPVATVREQLGKQIAASLADSPLFSAYLRWLPVVSAVGIWFLLELLRNLILSNVAGFFNYVFVKIHEKN